MQNMQKDVEKIIANKNEEITHLKDHNEKLFMQTKKLTKDKKLLESKIQQFIEEASKSLDVQVEEKWMKIDPVNITTQENDNPTEVKTYSEVAIPTTKIQVKIL